MKKIIVFIIFVLLMTSCKSVEDSNLNHRERKIISKVEKANEKYNGYKCKANIKIIFEGVESNYIIEEYFTKPNNYRLEILAPKESKGIIILNTDDKIFIEHPSINESISLVTIKSLNKQMLMGGFYDNILNTTKVSLKEMDDNEYYIFDFELEDKNKYRDTAKIWIDKKNLIPFKLNIFDDGGSLQVEITYDDFKFIKGLK